MIVIQPWLTEIPLRMQAVLLMATRGPDTQRCPGIKEFTRWIRSVTFVPANPANVAEFMKNDLPDRIKEKSATHRELEFVTQHFYTHLMHGFQVIGYRHPNNAIRLHGFLLYEDMCRLFHLPAESKDDFEHRLRMLSWPGGEQPLDGLTAFNIIEQFRK